MMIIFNISLAFLVIFTHICVIVLIRSERKTHTNRIGITIHLAVVEIFINVGYTFLKLCRPQIDEDVYYHLYISAFLVFGILYYIMFLVLVFDRFLEIFLNIKYPIYLREKHFYAVAIWLWSTVAILSIVLGFQCQTEMEKILNVAANYIYPIIDVLTVVITTSIYIYILLKMSKNSVVPEYIRRRNKRKRNIRCLKRTLMVFLTTLISLLPIFVYLKNGGMCNAMEICFLIMFLRDGVLHVILQEHVRVKIHKFIMQNKVLPQQADIFTLSFMNGSLTAEQKVSQWRRNNASNIVSKEIFPF